jgi:hypothetical protein
MRQHMIGKVLDVLFGCRHHRMTRPITPVRRYDTPPGDTYVTCLECGKQFYYDTANMRIGRQMPLPRTTAYGRAAPFQSQY